MVTDALADENRDKLIGVIEATAMSNQKLTICYRLNLKLCAEKSRITDVVTR